MPSSPTLSPLMFLDIDVAEKKKYFFQFCNHIVILWRFDKRLQAHSLSISSICSVFPMPVCRCLHAHLFCHLGRSQSTKAFPGVLRRDTILLLLQLPLSRLFLYRVKIFAYQVWNFLQHWRRRLCVSFWSNRAYNSLGDLKNLTENYGI